MQYRGDSYFWLITCFVCRIVFRPFPYGLGRWDQNEHIGIFAFGLGIQHCQGYPLTVNEANMITPKTQTGRITNELTSFLVKATAIELLT